MGGGGVLIFASASATEGLTIVEWVVGGILISASSLPTEGLTSIGSVVGGGAGGGGRESTATSA